MKKKVLETAHNNDARFPKTNARIIQVFGSLEGFYKRNSFVNKNIPHVLRM
jgi:hypothetical protein